MDKAAMHNKQLKKKQDAPTCTNTQRMQDKETS